MVLKWKVGLDVEIVSVDWVVEWMAGFASTLSVRLEKKWPLHVAQSQVLTSKHGYCWVMSGFSRDLGPLHTWDWEAHGHYTSSTLIGGKGETGPSSLPTTLEGPAEYVNARWMSSLHGFVHGMQWIMFHGHLDYFQKPLLGGRSNTKPGDHGTSNAHNRWFIVFYHVWGPAWIDIHGNSIWLRAWSHMTSHTTLESPWPHCMTLEVSWNGLWTHSFGLS